MGSWSPVGTSIELILWGMHLNTFPNVFTHRLRVRNTVIFSDLSINAAGCAVWAMLDQHTLYGFPTLGFSLNFYVSIYHKWRDNAPPGGVLCDSPLDFVIRGTNKIESFRFSRLRSQ